MDEIRDEIIKSDYRENAIEWYTGEDIMTLSVTQIKFKNKIKKLAELYPNEVQIIAENEDGSIYCKLPLKYLKIQKPREYTEEEKKIMAERLAKYRKI